LRDDIVGNHFFPGPAVIDEAGKNDQHGEADSCGDFYQTNTSTMYEDRHVSLNFSGKLAV
jgi:hypothetical protein